MPDANLSSHAASGSVSASYRRIKFVDRVIQGLKPGLRRVDYWDDGLPGFGLRVSPIGRKSPQGRKTWIVMYRRPTGSVSRLKLGTYPSVSLADARLEAKRRLGEVELEGRDPIADRHAKRDAETFTQLAEEYMRRWAKQVNAEGKPRKRTWREDQRKIDRYLLPEWRHRKVRDITRRDVRDLMEAIAERRLRKGRTEDGREKIGAPIMANRVLALAKKIFNFAIDREWIEANPAARLKPVAPERVRDRVLSVDEIRTVWSALEAEHYRIRTLFRVLFFTAQRSGEVSRMRWAHLAPRLDARETDGIKVKRVIEPAIWTIPASEVKNAKAHEVPLSSQVVRLLQELAETDESERRRINAEIREKRHQPLRTPSEWVFPSSKADGPILETQKAVQRLRKRCGFSFTAHDLRRTAATLMPDAGVQENIIPKVLNHKEAGVTRRHYNLHAYRNEKRAALASWATHLEAILTPEQAVNGAVVPFRRS